MKNYCLSKTCRRKMLAEHFGESIEDCEDKCDNCVQKNSNKCSPKKAKLG